MIKRILAVSSILFCLVFGLTSSEGADSLDLEDGKYEITYRSEMQGMPIPMPPITLTQCLTQQDPVPNQSAGSQECTIKDMKTKGNTVSWTMECVQQGSLMRATGRMTYNGNNFEGETRMKMGPEAGNQELITRIQGKRIGPCQ